MTTKQASILMHSEQGWQCLLLLSPSDDLMAVLADGFVWQQSGDVAARQARSPFLHSRLCYWCTSLLQEKQRAEAAAKKLEAKKLAEEEAASLASSAKKSSSKSAGAPKVKRCCTKAANCP